MVDKLTTEQVELAKQKQRAVISECDKAIADLQYNVGVLNSLLAEKTTQRNSAQRILSALEKDFPSALSTL